MPPDDSEQKATSRGARLVGRIADPAADDGLSLSGPGAPETGSGSTGDMHPVKARLLARARLANGEGTEEDRQLAEGHLAAPSAPAPHPDTPRTNPATLGTTSSSVSDLSPEETEKPGEQGLSFSAPAMEKPTRSTAASRDDDGPGPRPSSPPPPSPTPERSGMPPSSSSGPTAPPVVRETGAREAYSSSATPDQDLDPPLTPPPGAVANELDRIARRSGGQPPTRAGLSPNTTALLSALLGLCLVGSIGIFAGPMEWKTGTPKPAPEPEDSQAAAAQKSQKPKKPKRKKLAGPWRVEHDRNKPGHEIISGQIGHQAFLRAIQDAGLPKGQAYRAYGALKNKLDLDHCDSSDTFRALVKGRDKQLVAFEYEKSKEEVYQAKESDDGRFVGKQLDLKVERNQIRRAFVFDGKSFEDSARRGGFDPGLKSVAEDAFRGHLSLRELDRGDRLRVIAQEVTVLGEFSRYSGIEAVEILRSGKEPQRIYYYSHAVEGGYFDENGKAPYEGGWRKPIPDAPVTSKFNMKRMHPVLDKVMPHTGTDFGAAMGTPIGATAPGVVVFRGNAGASGNLVKIKHDSGYESGYAHLSRFEKGLNVGDEVDRLQTIGYCGSTGRSTGPHLHFTMKKDGKYIDPESLNLDGLRVLPPSHRPAFAEVKAKYDPILDAIQLPPPLKDQASPEQETQQSATPSREASSAEKNPMVADEPAKAPSPKQAESSDSTQSGPPAKSVEPSSIFLTDQELLRMQTATDDGEVNE